jgi:hypothetical protein
MPPTPPAAPSADQPDAPLASPAERIDFLKESIAFTEATIRAYDTKSQIALAAFVLSMNPLWNMLTAACANVAARPMAIALLAAFVATILSYGFVLWPIQALESVVKNVKTKGLFFIIDPISASSTYTSRLKELSVEPELAAEALKIAFIRTRKTRRFKHALWATGAFYALVLATFLVLRRCA